MRYLTTITSALILTSSLACSVAEDLRQSESEVSKFHQQLNNADIQTLYLGASEGLKSASSQSEFSDYLAAVHRKLGLAKGSKRISINASGTFITTEFETEFAGGQGTEHFVFEKSGGQLRLHNYSIQSNALVLK